MKTCKNCGAEIADNEKFCKVCGSAAEESNDNAAIVIEEQNDENVQEIPPVEAEEITSAEETPKAEEITQPAPVTPVYDYKNYGEYHVPAADSAKQIVEEPLSLGKWILTYLWLAIPFVNVIIWIVWLCGGSKYKTRVNMVRGKLLFDLIMSVVSLVAVVVLLIVMPTLLTSIWEAIQNVVSNVPLQ